MPDLPLITTSRLTSARACLRRHHLAYNLGIRPLRLPEPLRFGSLVHHGLETIWRQWMGQNISSGFPADGDAYEYQKAVALLRGYRVRWEQEQYEVLGVEVPFECDLINPATGFRSRTWRLAGKIDAIVRHIPTGKVYVVEHKTSSEDITPGSNYWKRLRMDSQISIYFKGARALGHDVEGCIYDVVYKPQQRPFHATPEDVRKYKKDGTLYATQRDRDETPSEYGIRIADAIAEHPNRYYVRGEVVRLEKELEESDYDVWQTAEIIRMSELSGKHPRNPKSCDTPGYSCPYFAICCGEASKDDLTLFKKSEHIHPELAEVANGR